MLRNRARRGAVFECVLTFTFVLSWLVVTAGRASAEEPGVAAVGSARAAIAKLAAAAAAPTPATEALGEVFLHFARPGAPPAPSHGESVDAAARPYFADLQPKLVALREEVLERRHRFLTGEDRPPPPRPELVNAVFDVRSLAGRWDALKSVDGSVAPIGSMKIEPSATVPRPLGFDIDKLRDLVDSRCHLGEGSSCDASNGALVLRATPEGVARTRELLDRLREVTGARVSVDVAAYRMTREVWREHAAQTTAADAERVLAAAVADRRATLLAARNAVMEDGGVTRLRATSSRRYLASAKTNQTGVVPVVIPELGRLDLGLQGDVRVTTLPGGREVLLDLDLLLSELKALKKETVAEHELDLPRTIVTRCATTLSLPLGGSRLVGGTFAGSEDAASACVFFVRVTSFGEKAAARPARPAPPAAPARPTRPELADLDALLVLVEDALAKVEVALRMEIGIFDVRDITEGPHARTAPALGLSVGSPWDHRRGQGMAGATLSFNSDASDMEGPLGIPLDRLEQLVKNSTGADAAWGDPASYELHRSELIVAQTPGELALVTSLLDAARKTRSGDVAIEVEVLALEDALVRELTRGGSNLGRDAVARLDALVAAGERASRTASGFVVAQRGDQAVLQAGLETTYVAAFEKVSGGTGMLVEKVGTPVLGLAREGLTLEAQGRGDALGAEGALTLDADARLARVTELPTAHTPTGTVTVPSLDRLGGRFDGPAPDGALLLVVGRRAGEKRPAVVIVLRCKAVVR